MTLMHLARAERADLLALLASLEPHQWDGPTLCAGWRVRDVVAHMISYEGLGRHTFPPVRSAERRGRTLGPLISA